MKHGFISPSAGPDRKRKGLRPDERQGYQTQPQPQGKNNAYRGDRKPKARA